ncbi:MAG TPA: diaminobutyrate--2-oxoglutarate transaminase [Polyangiaceae bacterium]
MTPTLNTSIFESHESNVRSYARAFPTVFQRAKGAKLFDERGREYIDFFAGAGSLNYGHNPDFIRERLVAYLQEDNVSHALDMFTVAKREFLTRFVNTVLVPRKLDYKVQFVGPTGADSVEAALKLARLATGRYGIASFTGGWHGMTLGCLQVTANRETRATAGAPLPFTTFLPYGDGPTKFADSLTYVRAMLEDASSGVEKPAAILLETVQAEGGIYVAPPEWLKGLRALCDAHGVLMIVDDVQVGCGRTGSFFSFERAGIAPDIVTLSKSIGGYGLPMALVLLKREIDVWKPAQHTGTFRGNQLAFIAAAAALERYWQDDRFAAETTRKGELVRSSLAKLTADPRIVHRGLGLIHGVDFARAGAPELARSISRRCFERGLIVECCGRGDTVLKILPPLTIEDDVLAAGCAILVECATAELEKRVP